MFFGEKLKTPRSSNILSSNKKTINQGLTTFYLKGATKN
ncbi:MAG: Unknown protein [uncultured Aureispira sp.]|uniref:Uncharacterized protein n=1 Tax=uncultured Aureispira sp. TaxID=1331704 RepID=A0A6S6S9P5_9BACT|nr:MAG: Unknown protein [uncultured Aureispira sp.]